MSVIACIQIVCRQISAVDFLSSGATLYIKINQRGRRRKRQDEEENILSTEKQQKYNK